MSAYSFDDDQLSLNLAYIISRNRYILKAVKMAKMRNDPRCSQPSNWIRTLHSNACWTPSLIESAHSIGLKSSRSMGR